MNKIFKYFTIGGKDTSAYIHWFVSSFPISEFSGINKILYLYLNYCSSIRVEAKRTYFLVFLSTELKRLVREYDIHIDALTANYNYDEISAFEQAIQVISMTTLDTYDLYTNEPIDPNDNFKVLITEFMSNNLRERVTNIMMTQFSAMNQGKDIITVAEDTRMALSGVSAIYNLKKITKLDFLLGRESDASNEDVATLLSKTGIPSIDEDYGGVFSKALITFAGQPGSGKTRFLCAVFVYPALVQYKIGVRFESIELQKYEIKNMLLSIHIANLYKIKIPDRDINRDYLSDEQRKIVESARIDLFESNKYGRLFLQHEKVYVETMYEDITSFLNLNRDIRIVVIDYVGRISSKPIDRYSRLSPSDIIDTSLQVAKDIASDTDTCLVCVNQYNDAGNLAAFAGKPITVGMIQGGQATQRHSDYDIAITFTPEQKVAGLRMISTTKERAAVGYMFVPLQVDMAISRFKQISKIEDRG